jgi:hypothetical protein
MDLVSHVPGHSLVVVKNPFDSGDDGEFGCDSNAIKLDGAMPGKARNLLSVAKAFYVFLLKR